MELTLTGFRPEAGIPNGKLRNIAFPCVGEYVTRDGFDSANRPTISRFIDIDGERFGAMWFTTDNAYINKLIDRLWADYKESMI